MRAKLRQWGGRYLVPAAFWIGLVVALAALWLTGTFDEAWQSLRDANIWLLIVTILVGAALPIIHAMRWRVVMRSLDARLSMGEAADITVSSSLLNYASPGFVGASAKAILANRTAEVPYRDSALAIGFEHSLDLFLLIIMSIIAILILGPSNFSDIVSFDDWFSSLLIDAIIVLVLAVIIFVAIKLGAIRYIRSLYNTVLTLGRKVDTRKVALLTLAYWLAQLAVVALLFLALDLPFEPFNILGIATVPVLVGMLSPVPGGVGVREAAIVALTTVTGILAATLLSLAILQRVLLIAALPLALLFVRVARWIGKRR